MTAILRFVVGLAVVILLIVAWLLMLKLGSDLAQQLHEVLP